jgi:hypothetical protein
LPAQQHSRFCCHSCSGARDGINDTVSSEYRLQTPASSSTVAWPWPRRSIGRDGVPCVRRGLSNEIRKRGFRAMPAAESTEKQIGIGRRSRCQVQRGEATRTQCYCCTHTARDSGTALACALVLPPPAPPGPTHAAPGPTVLLLMHTSDSAPGVRQRGLRLGVVWSHATPERAIALEKNNGARALSVGPSWQ